jgi:imidazolonepropionase
MRTCINNIGKLLNPRPDGTFDEISNAALLFDDRIILYGAESEVLKVAQKREARIIDAEGKIVTPGLVDSHTHTAFAEPRAGEFEMRNQGKSYREIAAAGGGIRSSVRSLRNLSEDELVERMLPRLDRFLQYGVTTVEVKSGYGLSTEHELKQLRAVRRCNETHPLDLVPTLLAAHEIPDEFRHDRQKYIDIVLYEIIPAAAEENFAEFCDVFCEKGVYTIAESRRILKAGLQHGLIPKIHADQLSYTGAAELAAELGAASADHLDYISETGIEKMVAAGVVFCLLPGAVIFLGLDRYPPARRIITAGGKIALSADFNPGSSPTQNLSLMMTLSCVFCGLTAKEALWAATRGGAAALKSDDHIGNLNPGAQADLVIWDTDDETLIPYYYGLNSVKDVFKSGRRIIKSGAFHFEEL